MYVPARVGSASGEAKQVPVPNLEVWLREVPQTSWESEHVVTDSRGQFQLAKPNPGVYQLHYSGTGFNASCLGPQFTVGAASLGLGWVAARPLKQALAGRVSMGAYPAYRESGFHALLAAATVRLKSGAVDVVPPVSVAADGQFILGNVPAGSYSLEASLEGTVAAQNVTIPTGGSNVCTDAYTVVPEYDSLSLPNNLPLIESVIAWDGASQPRADVPASSTVTVEATATDADLDYLHYSWKLGTEGFGQALTPIQVPPRPPGMDTPKLTWQVPSIAGSFVLHLMVSDSRGGFAWSQVNLTTDGLGALQTGIVAGSDGPVLFGASINIDGSVTTQTNALGHFSAFTSDTTTRHVLLTSASGYSPQVSLRQSRLVGARITLPRESMFAVNPTQPIDVTEDLGGTPGARIVIGPNQIVNGAGTPATLPVNLYVTSYDALSVARPLPGDSEGLSPAGLAAR